MDLHNICSIIVYQVYAIHSICMDLHSIYAIHSLCLDLYSICSIIVYVVYAIHSICMVMMMSCCLMSSDVSRHISDKLRPMPKHGSINLYVHGNQKAR